MAKIVDQIDEAALAAAQAALGTSNRMDTVNEALRDVVRRKVVASLLDDYAGRASEELDLLKAEAWE